MRSPEAFYLHLSGEQRGPYTIPQIDHLLNSGLIPLETLFWREGLEQWLPVTNLVQLRQKPNPWKRVAIAAAILFPLLLLGAFFGPAVADAWREATARDFTLEDAYWRARDAVRSRALPSGALAKFEKYETAGVELIGQDRATVMLRGRLMPEKGVFRVVTWRVELQYDAAAAAWSKATAKIENASP